MGCKPSPICSDPNQSSYPINLTKTRLLNRRVIIAVFIVSEMFVFGISSVDAGKLYLSTTSETEGISQSSVILGHYSGADDGFGKYDAASPNSNAPAIDMWSKLNSGSYLMQDSRGANSTTNFLVEISGRELAGSENVHLDFQMYPFKTENNFTWKNLVVELYNYGDIKDKANLLGVFDAADLVSKKIAMPTLSVNEGLSYQLVVRPRNYADFNLDNKVNISDFALLSEHWLSADPNELNTWEEYTDIDRDGSVGISDLAIFVNQWLFKGVDPNTFSRLDHFRNDESENILRSRNPWAFDNRLRIAA